jgi:hypothetical protein
VLVRGVELSRGCPVPEGDRMVEVRQIHLYGNILEICGFLYYAQGDVVYLWR